jgi:hypothetical protein
MWDDKKGLGRAATIGVFLAGVLLGAALGGAGAFMLGQAMGMAESLGNRFFENSRVIEPTLQKDPAFKALEITVGSDAELCLKGNVATASDKQRLQEIVTRAIGESSANKAMHDVGIQQKP